MFPPRFILKGCGRCGGDMEIEYYDARGNKYQVPEYHCLQCSHWIELPSRYLPPEPCYKIPTRR